MGSQLFARPKAPPPFFIFPWGWDKEGVRWVENIKGVGWREGEEVGRKGARLGKA